MKTRKLLLSALILGISVASIGCSNAKTEDGNHIKQDVAESSVESLWDVLSEEDMMQKDYLLYSVSCAGEDGTNLLGEFQSVSDQAYGTDPATGKMWGYTEKDYMESIEDETGKGLTRYRWTIAEGTDYNNEETGFYYTFELPKGEYEVTAGFFNPFSARPISIVLEEALVVKGEKILKYKNTEFTESVFVTDGALNVKVYNPKRGSDAQKDPILSYLMVRAVPEYTAELLSQYINTMEEMVNNPDSYTDVTYEPFSEKYEAAKKLVSEDYEPVSENDDTLRSAYLELKEAYENVVKIAVYDSIRPGMKWTDTEGNLIQAHGGQIQRLTVADPISGEPVEKWWWVGEDKSDESYGCIRAYSSDDLYNWTYEGIILQNVESRKLLDTDDYFIELYGEYSKEQKDRVYECLNKATSVVERPKMIYNKATGMYVLWFHADGPLEKGGSSYAAACAGVAVSETPNGPFRFIDRYRLNVCPPDQEDCYPESKGMARDMNLFVDEDGTAYIIYSSEENLTLYISRLNEEYTYLDVSPDKAIYGKDYIRLFPGAQREAPALFVKDGTYYLMTSGCTGWSPNQARYYMSDSIFGEWTNCGDPCVDDVNRTTFESQSTCIFQVEEGKYIYMGDRWNSSDLKNSRYVWLPVHFDEQGQMYLIYEEEWMIE